MVLHSIWENSSISLQISCSARPGDRYVGLCCDWYCWCLQPDLLPQATHAGRAETSSLPQCSDSQATQGTQLKGKEKKKGTQLLEDVPESTSMKINATSV